MKKIACCLTFLIGTLTLSSSQAQELNVNWVMVTAGCANPGFPYDQGFQDLINSIEHVGRFPWTTEIIRFTTANSGTWQTTYIEDRNNQCELTQDFTWKKDLQNQITFKFGKISKKISQPDPDNVTIDCSATEGATETYRLQMNEKKLLLTFPDDNQACGGFSYQFLKEH